MALAHCRVMDNIIARACEPEASAPLPKFDTRFARSFMEQYLLCCRKFYTLYWRNPEYNATRFYFSVAVALIFGTVFWKLGGKT